MTTAGLGWGGIVRLGLVQSAIGAIVMLATSLLNRIMVVEYALPAAVPAALVAWHYGVQLSRPAWGHGSDRGRRRTPWIIGGIAVLGSGALLAVLAIAPMARGWIGGYLLAATAFAMIGAGVGAAGTSLLALLATRVAPERRAAAASLAWILMVAGIAITAKVAGAWVDPVTVPRLLAVVGCVCGGALLVTIAAVWRIEGEPAAPAQTAAPAAPAPPLRQALAAFWADDEARRFTGFVFLSMFAYSMQDLILEPFAGLRFGLTPGESTQLSGTQHGGVLLGMILLGATGRWFGGRTQAGLKRWIVGGCVGSALALLALALAARAGPGWPLAANIFALGFANGIFAVAAIGTMMALAGAAGSGREGTRMGVWGAAQAVAFGLGGLGGALAVDVARGVTGSVPESFTLVFGAEALLFLAAAALSLRTASARPVITNREVLA